jgi:hypothetical protein
VRPPLRVYATFGSRVAAIQPSGTTNAPLVAHRVWDGRVSRSGGRTRLRIAGTRIPVTPHAATGTVDSASVAAQQLRLFGWAGDARRRRPASAIAVFRGDRLVSFSQPGVAHAGLTGGLGDAGFVVAIPPGRGPVRVYAIAGGRATQLAAADAAIRAQLAG